MVDVIGRAKQLYAEIILKDKTAEGAASARENFESVGGAADDTTRAIKETQSANEIAARTYANLRQRLEPLEAIQQKFIDGQRAVRRVVQDVVVGNGSAQRALENLQDRYDASVDGLQEFEKANISSAGAVEKNTQAVVHHESSIAGLAAATIQTLGSFAVLGATFLGFKVAQLEASDATRQWSVAMGILGRILPVVGVGLLAVAFVKLGIDGVKAINGIIASSVELAKVQREAEGQVVAAISSTGSAANRSIDDIRALANELQTLSNTADEVTIRAGAQLLTFTNIKGDNFDRALRIGNDVSARLQRDPEQVALQLGKALNDPSRNLGALTESGIQFTDGQRNLIKSLAEVGELATAQTIILAELETQFEGAARAQRLAEGGSIALANSWGDLKEELGDRIVEKTALSTDKLARAVGDPVWKGFFRVIGDIAGAMQSFQQSFRANLVQGGADFLRSIGAAISGVKKLVLSLRNIDVNFDLFDGLKTTLDFYKNLIEQLEKRAGALAEKIPAPIRTAANAVLDYAKGGPIAGALNVSAGAGRRLRENSQTDLDTRVSGNSVQQARGQEIDHKLAESLPAIVGHYESLTKKAREYYDLIASRGPEALENYQHQEELTKRVAEAIEGLPAAEAARIEQEIRSADALNLQTEALKRNASELENRKSILEELHADNDNLRLLVGAAEIGPDALEAEERRQEIESRILDLKERVKGVSEETLSTLLQENDALAARLTLTQRAAELRAESVEIVTLINAAHEGGAAGLDNAERRLDVEREIAELRLLADRAGERFDETATRDAINERDGRAAQLEALRETVYSLERDLNSVADSFVDTLVREGRFAFRELGQDLKSMLLDSVLTPFREGLRDLLNGKESFFGIDLSKKITLPGSLGKTSVSELVSGVGTGLGLYQASRGVLDATGLKPQTDARRYVGSVLGGASAGAALGSVIPGVGTAIGAGVGAAIGSGIGLIRVLFEGPPSDFVGQSVFDPVSGNVIGTGQKDNSEASNRNLDIAKAITDGVSGGLAPIFQLTGAELINNPNTAYHDNLFNVSAGDRDGIIFGNQGYAGEIVNAQHFENTEAGAQAAIEAGIKLGLQNLSGGDEVLTGVVRQLAKADEPLEQIISRVEKLSAALDVADEPVDEFKQRLDSLVDAFDGLNRTTGALNDAFHDAISGLAERANEENQEALDAILNPQKAQLSEQLEALNLRRDALVAINAEGGNVDLSLFNELARLQLLDGFNLDGRLAQSADPARASVDTFRETQSKELSALQSVVGQFGVTLSDVAALQRAQVFERRAFFDTIPEEDRLRLAGAGDEFLDLSGRYELAVDRLLEQSSKLVDGFEDRARELSDIESRERNGVLDYERAISQHDRRFGSGDPTRRVDVARATVDDLKSRALVSEDSEDRRYARDQLPQAVNDLAEIAQGAGASSPLAQEAVAYGRAALVEVKEARNGDADEAAASLATLQASRDYLEQIRDILASPELDAQSLADTALALPDGFDGRDLVVSLARDLLEIQEAQFEQNSRITAAIEALTPADVGLGAANDNPPAAEPSGTTVVSSSSESSSAPAQTAQAGGGSTQASQETDLITALYTVSKGLDKIYDQDSAYYKRQLDGTRRSDKKLGALVANLN